MGCDIHSVVQVRRNDQWRTVQVPTDMLYNDRRPIWEMRYYRLFAALADVRNDDGVTPIAEPRGLPDDPDADGDDAEFEGQWIGDHSFSWLTVAELNAYDWKSVDIDVSRWLPWLNSLAADPDDVRLVFGFDS